ncbi:MAG: hypothetical protein ACI906_003660 [Candidatus Latescibacterota bacterium]|jgi:hypothetical protein
MKAFNKCIQPGTTRLNIKRLHVGEMAATLNDLREHPSLATYPTRCASHVPVQYSPKSTSPRSTSPSS